MAWSQGFASMPGRIARATLNHPAITFGLFTRAMLRRSMNSRSRFTREGAPPPANGTPFGRRKATRTHRPNGDFGSIDPCATPPDTAGICAHRTTGVRRIVFSNGSRAGASSGVDAFGCLCSLRARSALDGVSWVRCDLVEIAVGLEEPQLHNRRHLPLPP